MACWSKFRVSTRIQNLGCFVAVILVAFLLLSDGLVDMVEAITHAGDIQALKQVSNKFICFIKDPLNCLQKPALLLLPPLNDTAGHTNLID
jgi:hypothetical protein